MPAIQWQRADSARIVPPAMARALLEQALARTPDNPLLHLKLGGIFADAFDFDGALACFAQALRLGGDPAELRPALAHCFNRLSRPQEALDILAAHGAPHSQRGTALLLLSRVEEARHELTALLEIDPNDRHALTELARILSDEEDWPALRDLCESLSARGARNAQLFTEWGRALALTGDLARARVLLFDPRGLHRQQLPPPAGYSDRAAFNAALSEELLSNPHAVAPHPPRIEANRGSQRIHALLAGKNPALIRALLARIEEAISAYAPEPLGDFDPWHAARPQTAYLHPWGLIQSGDAHEAWHNHRGGWLSGVYYVRVPEVVCEAGEGPGCIEFGPPPSLAKRLPGFAPVWRHAPAEGTLLLAPSHYVHRTIPTGADVWRISFAFDVVAAGR